MSVVFKYVDGKLVFSDVNIHKTERVPTHVCEDGKTYIIGEVFGAFYEEVSNSGWRKNVDALYNFVGAFSIAYVSEEQCVFATDINGIEPWYYYKKDNVFLLSDSFWEILKNVDVDFVDINREEIKTMMISSTVKGETVIKGLSYTPPAHMGVFSGETKEVTVKRYREFRYANLVSDVGIAVENMDRLLDEAMHMIKEKCGDVKYCIGISGGLDSRVIPHYARKYDMQLYGFNVCVPRPHGFFLAKSLVNARKIAKAYNIPYREVKWTPDKVEEKVLLKIRKYPLGTGRNTFKYESFFPEYDILLTGASGEIVGNILPEDIETFTDEMLIKVMQDVFISNSYKSSFWMRVARALKFLFGVNIKVSIKSSFSKLLKDVDIECAKEMIKGFVEDGKRKGQTNTEIYEDYLNSYMTSRNRNGGFESFLGQKRSFSIYVPFLFKEVLNWNPMLLHNRKALNELIARKIPEVKHISPETFGNVPGKKAGVIKKTMSLFSFLLRGNGVAIDQHWINKRKVKSKLLGRVGNDCQWFCEVFEVEKTELIDIVKKSNEAEFLINIWEMKALLDCIEQREYLLF